MILSFLLMLALQSQSTTVPPVVVPAPATETAVLDAEGYLREQVATKYLLHKLESLDDASKDHPELEEDYIKPLRIEVITLLAMDTTDDKYEELFNQLHTDYVYLIIKEGDNQI